MNTGAIGTVGSLDEEQQAVCKHLPQPIAAAWQQVLLARTNAQLEQRLLGLTDVLLRTLGVLALSDYLRGPPVKDVENLLPSLDEPQPDAWYALLNACVDAIFRRVEPRPFALELLVWAHGPRGEPAAGQRLLEKVLKLRRELMYQADTLVIEESGTPTERLLVATLAVCESLSWLGLYRLLRPATLTTLRNKGFAGRIQFLVGGGETPPSVEASWTAHLLLDTVYWSNPDASALLEISPFIRTLPHPRLKRTQCFLFAAAPGLKRLQLRHDPSEMTVETSIAGPDGEWPLSKWLEKRSEHVAWLENHDLSGNLAADSRLAQPKARHRTPSRPIPDLSPESFRQPAWSGGRRPSSALTPAVRKQKQLLLIGQVVILVVIVGVGARMLGSARSPGRNGEHQVHIDDRGVASVVAKTRGGHEATETAPLPEAASATAARVAEQARETARQAARHKFEEGSAVAQTQPIFAALKWEVAAYEGDWRGDRELARLMIHYLPAQRQRCQKHALRALTAQQGDAEMTLLAGKCGVRPGTELVEDRAQWQASLRTRLLEQAQRLVAGKKLHIAENSKMARSLFTDAGQLGAAHGWLGAAQVAWQGEHDAPGCKRALAEAGKFAGLTDAEKATLAELRAAGGE